MVPESMMLAALTRLYPFVPGPEALPDVPSLLGERGGEFCISTRLDPQMVAAVCRCGYLPMSEDMTGRELLLIKSHTSRCILDPSRLHVSRSTRRRARGLRLRVDSSFGRCLDRIVKHHADERWLTQRLCDAFTKLHDRPMSGVRMRSVEVYGAGGMVAGEIGYTCGRAYTSLSGFHAVSGAGSVQLACLGRLLDEADFAFWDLGMEIEYKHALGATSVDRPRFLERYRSVRDQPTPNLRIDVECGTLLCVQDSTG